MKKRIANVMVLALFVAGTCGWAVAQSKEETPDRAVVPLSNPAQPAKIEVTVMRGSITVKGYQGKEIIVEARVREKALAGGGGFYSTGVPYAVAGMTPPGQPTPAPAPAAKPGRINERAQREVEAQLAATLANQEALAKRITGQYERAAGVYGQFFGDDKKALEEKEKKIAGMKRLSGSTSGLEVEEEGNVVQISTQSWKAATDLVIQVPVASSLEIRSSMDGTVVVEGVNGEIDINNINGPVTLRNVSGNTLVHTVNGDIDVVLTRVAAEKPLTFSTMNGDIDITLPADVKANLKMKSEQGEIYSDFDINMTRQPARSEASEKTEQGKYRIAFDKSLYGLINGGGQEMGFNTFSGDIYIRKRK
jgi:Putative adhesin